MKQTPKATEALNEIIELFSSKTFHDTLAAAYISGGEKPSAKWSLMNRIIMMYHRTNDARGYRQWQDAGRYVKKGSKAFYILKVRTVKKKEIDKETGKETEVDVPIGMIAIPVFRYEDTDGKSLTDYEPKGLLPLQQVAENWGVRIVYDAPEGMEHGSFNQLSNTIRLCIKNGEKTFFHELSHKAHSKIEKLKGGQDPRQETIAELSAAVLAKIYGYENEGFSWNYIAAYNGAKTPEAVGRACMGVLSTVQKILDMILAEESKSQKLA